MSDDGWGTPGAFDSAGSGGGGGGRSFEKRPGDWTCPDAGCGANNFARRSDCHKCGTEKPEGAGGDSGGRTFEKRPGDWTCPDEDCGASNFARRSDCHKCGAEKPEGVGGGGDGGRTFEKRPGDWTCPDEDCGANNFARRSDCHKCGKEKPEDLNNNEEGESRGPRVYETKVMQNEDGTTREIYVPMEKSEEQLFDSAIASGINFDKYDKIKVNVSGENAPKPIKSFEDSGLRTLLLDNVAKSGYKKPTPVQKTAIPIVMAKRDLMGCAQTGSGKTAAFLLPIINTLLEEGAEPNAGGSPQTPQAVIVAPTRELAIQIKDEARKFAKDSILRSVVLYGGTSTGFQLQTLFRGCNLLIATVGRLMDVVEKGKVSFENVKYLVLDEADRMLDMGFHPEIKRIVAAANMPAKGERQTLMFSATFPNEVQQLAHEFLNTDYIFVAVGIVGGACSDVVQKFVEVPRFEKRNKLKEVLVEGDPQERCLVFVETKRNADFIAAFLSQEGLPTTSIHGDRLQREREEALGQFKSGRMPILVATAVAARGLDIRGVGHVINYDLPKSIDEFVHRIGRTGRVGNIGKATSFFDPGEDAPLAADLVKILGQAEQEVPSFITDAAAGGGAAGGYGGSGFGGHDVRGGPTTNAAEEESWD